MLNMAFSIIRWMMFVGNPWQALHFFSLKNTMSAISVLHVDDRYINVCGLEIAHSSLILHCTVKSQLI